MTLISRSKLAFVSMTFSCLMLVISGCGNPEVGTIKPSEDGTVALKSKTEGRFKETVPSKPARGKVPAGKSTVDEGIETR
jgi:hypothetical protein